MPRLSATFRNPLSCLLFCTSSLFYYFLFVCLTALGNSSTQQVPCSIPFPAFNSFSPPLPLSFLLSTHPLSPIPCLHWCICFSMLRVCVLLLHDTPVLPPALPAAPPLLFTSGCGALPSPPPLDCHFSLPPVSHPALSSDRIYLFLFYSLPPLCFPPPSLWPCLSSTLTPFLRGLYTTYTC